MSQDPYSAPGQQPAAPYVPQPASPAVASQPQQASQSPGEVNYDQPMAAYPVASQPTGFDGPSRYDEKNWLGVAALICAFLIPVLGIIFGHLGMSAAKKDKANNRGMALAGAALGYAFTFFAILFFALTFAFAASAPIQ